MLVFYTFLHLGCIFHCLVLVSNSCWIKIVEVKFNRTREMSHHLYRYSDVIKIIIALHSLIADDELKEPTRNKLC